jgi:hypothetical protein
MLNYAKFLSRVVLTHFDGKGTIMKSYPYNLSSGLKFFLVFLTVVYLLGAVYALLIFSGLQSYDPAIWQPHSAPLFALIFVVAAGGATAALRRKKSGIYILMAAWAITVITNLAFQFYNNSTGPLTAVSVLLLLLFFLLLLQEWQHFE